MTTNAREHSEAENAAAIWEYGGRLRNWGQWGDQDERGSMNHISPAARVRAAGLVRRGVVFSLALPIRSGKGPMRGLAGRTNPIHQMTVTGGDHGLNFNMGAEAGITDGVLTMGCQTTTQWDALCHVYYKGQMYNGFPASDVTIEGAPHDGIDKVHSDFVGRGVLLDFPRLHAVGQLEPGYAISADELDECAAQQGVEVGEGDMLLIRTGALTRVSGDDWSGFYEHPRAGLHYTAAEWLAQRGVAAVAADNNGVEAPSPLPGVRNPFHMVALRDLGLHIGEFWDLETLAADCEQDGVYEFLLIAQPLPIEGAAGSPVNPLAIK